MPVDEAFVPLWQPHDWRDDIDGHPCYDPERVRVRS
jgi:hypothetical protein